MDEILLVPGSVTGYRVWHTGHMTLPDKLKNWKGIPWGSDSYLFSLNQHLKWKVEKVEARCQLRIPKKGYIKSGLYQPHDKAPHVNCQCGFYAKYNMHTLIKDMYGYGDSLIMGAIEGWGKTILAKTGFRCQYAKITAIVATNRYSHSYLRHVGSHYNVPIFNRPEELEKAFPPSDLSALGVKRKSYTFDIPLLPEF